MNHHLAVLILRALLEDFLTKPPFGVTSAEVAIICPDSFIKDQKTTIHCTIDQSYGFD